MPKSLVTGGAGFIGSHIADALIERGHEVVVVDNLVTGAKENVNSKAKFVELDIVDQKLGDLMIQEKFDYVFHSAAQIDLRKSIDDPVMDANTNILGAINVIHESQKAGAKKFIFSSSGGAMYGEAKKLPTRESAENPLSPYGIAKKTIELYLAAYFDMYHMPYVSLRYANIYGPRQSTLGEAGVVAALASRILSDKECVIFGDGAQTRDFTYVGDVVEANMLAMESDFIGSVNIGTAKEISINDLAQLIQQAAGTSVVIPHKEARFGDVLRSCLDSKLAKKELGWQPLTKIKDGIQLTVDWFKAK